MKRWVLALGLSIVAASVAAFSILSRQPPKSLQQQQQAVALPAKRLSEDLYYMQQRLWRFHSDPQINSRKLGWVQLPESGADNSKTLPQERSLGEAAYVGPAACAECHQENYEGYIETAHYSTSRPAERESILGSFEDRKNLMKTTDDRLSFLMEARGDGCYQTALVQRGEQVYAHSERIDLITGSGNHGQSYLYWDEDDRLYELPVSYFKSSASWINSPGYKDGTADFARPIRPRCLECHSTFFENIPSTRNKYVRDNFILGVSCEKCHGPGSEHAAHHRQNLAASEAQFIVHPGNLERDRMNEVCAQCHSGAGKPLKEPFSYRPGKHLEEYIELDHAGTGARQGVHTANQLARLTKSRCYSESPDMACVTCHDPHQNEHGRVDLFSQRCQKCHEAAQCAECVKDPVHAVQNCIDCHMPTEAVQSIEMETRGGIESPQMRDHFIRILPGSGDSPHGGNLQK